MLNVGLHFRVIDFAADEAIGIEYGVVRVLRGGGDQPFGVEERDIEGRRAVSLVVGGSLSTAVQIRTRTYLTCCCCCCRRRATFVTSQIRRPGASLAVRRGEGKGKAGREGRGWGLRTKKRGRRKSTTQHVIMFRASLN